jgi:hypothetical protein
LSRTTWTIAALLAFATLLLPGFWERWRRVRRALGTLLVFWIALSLWGTTLHFLGFRALGEGGPVLFIPPLVLAAAWVYLDLKRRPSP